MQNRSYYRGLAAIAALICLSLSACSTSPKSNAQLDQAKRQYEEASRDPDIVRQATPELDLARDALEMAEVRRLKNANSQIAHYVYLFEQHLRMANLAVEQRRVQSKLESGLAEKAEMLVMRDSGKHTKDKADAENWDLLLAAANGIDSTNAENVPENRGREKVMTLGDVLFKVNGTRLAAGADDMIENLVLFLNRNSAHMAVIEGHTDSTGGEELNRILSRDRALAVQEALVKAGISAQRLAVRGLGASDPVASNDSESGRSLNRRVDVVLLE